MQLDKETWWDNEVQYIGKQLSLKNGKDRRRVDWLENKRLNKEVKSVVQK